MPTTTQADPSGGAGPCSEEFALLTDQFRPELLVHCFIPAELPAAGAPAVTGR